MIANFFNAGLNIFKDLFRRTKNRDFSGNTGLALKNSLYQISTQFVSKGGSLVLTVILARLLMPELFGLYNLALSTVLVFASFSDLGINQAIVRFVSFNLGRKNPGKAKSYARYFGKIKILSTLITAVLLLSLAKFLSANYYQKPIFLALLAGTLYVVFVSLASYLDSYFQSMNNFKNPLIRETILQVTRIVIVPLLVLLSIKNLSSQDGVVTFIFLGMILSYFISLLYLLISKKEDVVSQSKEKKLSVEEKKKAKGFIIALSTLIFSGLFLSYVDVLMLGRFVTPEFIGYYRAAFSPISAIIPLLALPVALLPIFSRLKGKSLERGLKISAKATIIVSLISAVIIFLISEIFVWVVFGSEYAVASFFLKLLTPLILILPLSALYESFLISQNKPEFISKYLIISTAINIVLNYILILLLLPVSETAAVAGVSIATILSRAFYLLALSIKVSSKKP